MLSLRIAPSRTITSLQNWVHGNGCIAREEIEYLNYPRELVELGSERRGATNKIESWVEDKLIRFCKGFRKVRIYTFWSISRQGSMLMQVETPNSCQASAFRPTNMSTFTRAR